MSPTESVVSSPILGSLDNNVNISKGKRRICCSNTKCQQVLTSEKSLWLDEVMSAPPVSREIQLEHAWSPTDHSENIYIKKDDPLTLHRQPVAKSTDACRGCRGISRGLHVWQIQWAQSERGSDAVVGVATDTAPLHCSGYHGLVGGVSDQSWGWDIVRLCTLHNYRMRRYPSCPLETHTRFPGLWNPSDVPDIFHMVLDMEEGTLSFVVNGRFVGNAFTTGLKGRTLFPVISSVWGHCEVTLTYINGRNPQPSPLIELSRRVIRDRVIEAGGAKGLLRMKDLRYPSALKSFILHRCSLIQTSSA